MRRRSIPGPDDGSIMSDADFAAALRREFDAPTGPPARSIRESLDAVRERGEQYVIARVAAVTRDRTEKRLQMRSVLERLLFRTDAEVVRMVFLVGEFDDRKKDFILDKLWNEKRFAAKRAECTERANAVIYDAGHS